MLTTKLWLDGCFDGFHYAHANAFRQARTLVESPVELEVIAGVHSDLEITKNKGPPLFDEKERYAMIRSCRWVSRVVEDVPYVTQTNVFEKYGVDFIVHGDDVATDADGNDCYAVPKALGRYKEVIRTRGISTTSLIDRVLYPEQYRAVNKADSAHLRTLLSLFSMSAQPQLPIVDLNVPSTSLTKLFPPSALVVFLEDNWDLFSSAHVDILQRAREVASARGSPNTSEIKLVVGVIGDKNTEEQLTEPPVFVQYERALHVAQCRFVDAIVMQGDRRVSHEMLLELGVQVCIRRRKQMTASDCLVKGVIYMDLPDSPNDEAPMLHTAKILRDRLQSNLVAYEERQRRKACKS